MLSFVRKWWAEIFVFLVIAAVILIDLSPGITWINTDSDGAHYILAAKYFTTAHNMSAPLYLILGHFALQLPFSTEAWRMGLLSAIPAIIASVLIYMIVRELLSDNPRARLCGMVAALVYGGSALVISQSTIIETYSMSTMAGLAAYYFVVKKRWLWASVMLGFGMPIHPFLTFIVWAVLFFSQRELRRWKPFIITCAFFAFYLYIPIVARFGEPSMWGNTSPKSFVAGITGMVTMLSGGLAMWDIPKRVIDTLLLMVVSLGVGVIPLVYYFKKVGRWSYHLLWLFGIPIMYFATNLSSETYVYMIVAVAYGSIAFGLGLAQMNKKWLLPIAVGVLSLSGFNANYFDIGRTLDPEMSAMKFYNEELPKIKDGEIFMGGGWNWAMVYLYNKQEGRAIVPVSTDMFPSPYYRTILDKMGVNYRYEEGDSFITTQSKMAVSVAQMNKGVWITKETKPEVFQYVVEPALGNEDYIMRWAGQDIQPSWKWKPSNPYKFITGALEVSEWNRILWSNKNANMVLGLAGISYGLYWYVMRWWDRRKNGSQGILQKA